MDELDRERIKKKYKELEKNRYQIWWKEIDDTKVHVGIGKTVGFLVSKKVFDKDNPVPKDLERMITETANECLACAMVGGPDESLCPNRYTGEQLSYREAIADLEDNIMASTEIVHLQ